MNVEVRKDGVTVEVVERKPFHKGFCGNFVPHYVRYKNKIHYLCGGIDYAYMHGQPDVVWIDI